ncbi:hypothetical protein D3C81_1779560 [compost metagenome]
MQVENGQARIAAFGNPGREKTATVSERQQVADQCRIPRAIGHPGRQHLVEEIATRRGQQPRTDIALLWQGLAFGPLARIEQVTAGMTEALGAEIVRYALLLE